MATRVDQGRWPPREGGRGLSKGVHVVNSVDLTRRHRRSSHRAARVDGSRAGAALWVIAGLFFALNAPAAYGQTRVAVIDIERILHEHPRLIQQREAFRRESEAMQAYIQQERTRMQKMAEQLREYKPGTEAYRNLEKELANADANLAVQMKLKQKDVGTREAKIMYQAYMEVVNLVSRYCQRNGIGVVLRYRSKPIDPDDPRSIQAGMLQEVVYHRGLDITDDILAEIKRGVPPAGTMSSAPQIPRRR